MGNPNNPITRAIYDVENPHYLDLDMVLTQVSGLLDVGDDRPGPADTNPEYVRGVVELAARVAQAVHVGDGDWDTADLADAIAEHLALNGWGLVRKGRA